MLFSLCSRRKKERDGSLNRDRVNALRRVRLRENISAALPSATHRHPHAPLALCSHGFFSIEQGMEQPSTFDSRIC